MKVLVSTFPYTGHFNPTQPIVRELVKRGHEVVWICGKDYESKVVATGARFEQMAADALIDDYKAKDAMQAKTLGGIIKFLRFLFIDRVPAQVRDYQRVLETFPADILMVEMCTWGAHSLHELTGLPYATLGTNPLVSADPEIPPWGTGAQPPTNLLGRWKNVMLHTLVDFFVYRHLTTALNEERKGLGLPPLPRGVGFADVVRSELLHIQQTTLAFELPRKFHPAIRFVGPLLPLRSDADFVPPQWWDELLARPREKVVHITQGTIATELDNLINPTLRVLSRSHFDNYLVIVTGKGVEDLFDATSAKTGGLVRPSNVRTAEFVPHLKLLPHVGVMVTNAGYNGVLAALSCGVPMVCAGKTEDKADVSSRVAWCGAGINLNTDRPSEGQLDEGIREVAENEKYRVAAQRVQDDFAKHNAPVEAVDALEEVVKKVQGK